MRRLLVLLVFWLQVAMPAGVLFAQGPREIVELDPPGEPRPAPAVLPAGRVVGGTPVGLSLRGGFARGKVPVVFVHGLWSTPVSWQGMIAALEAEPSLNGSYQFWTFGYETGDPLPYSAWLLRQSLAEARQRFDRDPTEPSFDRMVLVGHSMGGLLAKMTVVDGGSRLWRDVSDRPFDQLAGEPADRSLFGQALLIKPLPGVRRVIFIATPHRGSRLDRGWVQSLGSRLVRRTEPMQLAYDRLLARNGRGFFKDEFQRGLPSSIDELRWEAPFLRGLLELGASPEVKFHSIIAVRPDWLQADRTDGLVSYASAHLEGASSEVVVPSGHLCQDHPEVIREVRRVLMEHRGR